MCPGVAQLACGLGFVWKGVNFSRYTLDESDMPMLSTKLFEQFFASEKSGGLVLICVTAFALLLANSPVKESLIHFFHHEYFGLSVEHWVNDGLMFVFFLMIGLELEREIY